MRYSEPSPYFFELRHFISCHANARRIIDSRNRIIHGYNTVSDAIIRSIVRHDPAGLESGVVLLLAESWELSPNFAP